MAMSSEEKQYLIFLKYTREYLSQVTGYSRGYLSRNASGAKYPSDIFIGVCCHTLKEPQDVLFELVEPSKASKVLSRDDTLAQDLLETIDELSDRLTNAEAKIEALQKELRQYS